MIGYLTAGESHGPELVVIVEGVPAGLPLLAGDIDPLLAERQQGYGRGGRMKIEHDQVQIVSGVRWGQTLGSPIALRIANQDWANWQAVMSPEDCEAQVRADQSLPLHKRLPLTSPRPGHADLPGGIKYHRRDLRDILERSSARETAARVAAGAIGRKLLSVLGVDMACHVTALGGVHTQIPFDWEQYRQRLPVSQLRCLDPDAEAEMIRRIDAAKEAGDTLGGVVEVRARGLPVGLGSHVQWDRRLDARLAAAVLSIQAMKAVGIGAAWDAADLPGSQLHDEIYHDPARGFYRPTNRAGGLEGGMTNGEELVVRAVLKPLPTLMQPLASVDIDTKEVQRAARERSDVTSVPAASVIALAVTALVLADAVAEKFGGDTIVEIQERMLAHREYTRTF